MTSVFFSILTDNVPPEHVDLMYRCHSNGRRLSMDEVGVAMENISESGGTEMSHGKGE